MLVGDSDVVCVVLQVGCICSQGGGGGVKMPSPSFTLDAQLRFHDKWLKIDLQVCHLNILRRYAFGLIAILCEPGEAGVIF